MIYPLAAGPIRIQEPLWNKDIVIPTVDPLSDRMRERAWQRDIQSRDHPGGTAVDTASTAAGSPFKSQFAEFWLKLRPLHTPSQLISGRGRPPPPPFVYAKRCGHY